MPGRPLPRNLYGPSKRVRYGTYEHLLGLLTRVLRVVGAITTEINQPTQLVLSQAEAYLKLHRIYDPAEGLAAVGPNEEDIPF